jgi:phospholipid/cholesterol/gamma-HCH transport system permease protein
MTVSEEIDALGAMGLAPYPFLVLPRALTLTVVLPLLTVVADLFGVIGGLFVWCFMLDMEAAHYLGQIKAYVVPWDIEQGLVKSIPFGAAIALIACQRGLAARGGAEGVGRATTSAVVASTFAIVVLDFLATILFTTWERR